jgi:hypothetical protein
MFGLDENAVVSVELADVQWQIGSIPWGKFEALRIDFSEAWDRVKEAPSPDAPPDARADYQRSRIPLTAACAEMVRWGVRGWGGLPAEKTRASFGGKDFDVLSDRVVDYLARVSSGLLLLELATQVAKHNRVTESDLVGFQSLPPGTTG